MSLTGRLYVKPSTPNELEADSIGRRKSKETKEIDKGLAKLQQFIIANGTRELVTDRPFSFTLYREVSKKDHSKREVTLPKGTVLYFFAENYFTFDEGDHSLVVNLNTGNVRYRRHQFAAHVLVKSPTQYNHR